MKRVVAVYMSLGWLKMKIGFERNQNAYVNTRNRVVFFL